jgi:putative membrane protein
VNLSGFVSDGYSAALVAGLVALTALYRRGMARPRLIGERVGGERPVLFALALLIWLAVALTTLTHTGQRLFVFHQVQHLGLRLVAPLVFVLARPWPVLRAALPRSARRALRDLGARPAPRAIAHLATRLPVAFVVLIGWFYLWQSPALHNASLSSAGLTFVAHLGMGASGVLFFSVVLNGRGVPDPGTHGLRVLSLIGVILSNILLGSLTTLKERVIYTGYDQPDRLWGMAALTDETIGGYTIWVPSSMVIIIAILFAFHSWNAAEVRHWQNRHVWSGSNSAMLAYPETAAELRLKVGEPNRRVGRTLAVVSLSIFLVVFATAVTVLSLG